MTSILSIQSSVAYGHAGNSAATFPLMRMGVEVWPVLTVHFSNHTGYGAWRGPLLAADDVAAVIAGIDDRGVLGGCDAVLSGYQGAEDIGAVVVDAARLVRERNPTAVYCCDPVLGDVGRGFFVRPGIPEFMRDHVVPTADVITPNQFELEWLSGRTVGTLDELRAAVDHVRATGPQVVLVTSVLVDSTPADALQMVLVTPEGAWQVTTPRLPLAVNGCGDVTTAVFLARWLATGDPVAALGHTAGAVFGLLDATAAAGSYELRLVEAQDEFVRPSREFAVTPLG